MKLIWETTAKGLKYAYIGDSIGIYVFSAGDVKMFVEEFRFDFKLITQEAAMRDIERAFS